MNACFLLLGTNLGDKYNNLKQAREGLLQVVGDLLQSSGIYQTSAWGKENQDDFLNQVLRFETVLPPVELLAKCLAVEKELGRVRFEKWGERLIDIDILYYNSEVVDMPDLQIPHPYIQERRFTLVPLVELAPYFIHPKFEKDNSTLLAECTDPLEVKRIDSIENN